MISDIVPIHLYTPEEIAITKMLKYKINALPVVDSDKKMLGILTLDDIAEFILEELW
jgi:Mg/Co/Ni transporter MgtE